QNGRKDKEHLRDLGHLNIISQTGWTVVIFNKQVIHPRDQDKKHVGNKSISGIPENVADLFAIKTERDAWIFFTNDQGHQQNQAMKKKRIKIQADKIQFRPKKMLEEQEQYQQAI